VRLKRKSTNYWLIGLILVRLVSLDSSTAAAAETKYKFKISKIHQKF